MVSGLHVNLMTRDNHICLEHFGASEGKEMHQTAPPLMEMVFMLTEQLKAHKSLWT